MQDEILRIKQKDFTALDNKLFQNLQKADYLNSTLNNLQEFQKFLMNQISLYDNSNNNKVKKQSSQKKGQNQSLNCFSQEKYTKDQKQIIIQNCQNLKKSILRVMPIQVQTENILPSRRQQQKEKQTFMNFSRTKTTKYSYSRILDKDSYQPKVLQKKINNFSQSRQYQYQRLIKEISQLRAQQESLSILTKKNMTQMQQENKNYIKKNVQSLLVQNKSLLVQNNKLKTENYRLLRENQQKQFQIKKLQKRNFQLERKVSLWEEAKNRMNSRCASIDKQLQSNLKYQSSYQRQFQQKSFQKSYKCFKQKLDFNFTNKLVQSQLHLQQNQENHSQTFRQSSSILQSQTLINKNHFMSVQLKRQQQNSCAQNDNIDNHDLPRPLRRHSISNSLTKDTYSNKDLKNSQVLRQITKATISMSQNIDKNLNDSIQQKLLTRKKSNHDITRKTKSNFFKANTDTKNRQNLIQNLNEATQKAVKIKGLQQKQKRQRNPSKQKLKIFSFL